MSPSTVARFAKECNKEGFTGDIAIAGFGEPMLHPNLPALVCMLRNYTNCRIRLVTNGDLLTAESACELRWAGLTEIVVNCYDGPDQKKKLEPILMGSNIEWTLKEMWHENVVETNSFNNRAGAINVGQPNGGKCFIPFYKMFIDWNGDVLLCSQDWLRKQKGLGNINIHTLREIWFKTELTEVRRNLFSEMRVGACQGCNACGTLIGQESFDLFG
jgi:radical SAM protein with 4Fe4S-binding SPASM domain